jgi:hypothetical protein
MAMTTSSSEPTLVSGQTAWDQIETRLKALKIEFEAGQAELQRVMKQQTLLHETMLRISGAIQVLEELLAEPRNTSGVEDAPSAEVQTTNRRGAFKNQDSS